MCVIERVHMWASRCVPVYVRGVRADEFVSNMLQVINHVSVAKQWIWVLLYKNIVSDSMTLGIEDLNGQFGVFSVYGVLMHMWLFETESV